MTGAFLHNPLYEEKKNYEVNSWIRELGNKEMIEKLLIAM